MILLWLIYYNQCEFNISYISIPGIAAHDRCNISNIFSLPFQFHCCTVLFIYITVSQENSNPGSMVEGGGLGLIIICFRIDLFNLSQYLWSPFFLVLNNWDLFWLLLVLSLSLLPLLWLWLLFFYTNNQYNNVITYYSFKCYL